MKAFYILVLAALSFSACNNSNSSKNARESDENGFIAGDHEDTRPENSSTSTAQDEQTGTGNWQKLVVVPFFDQQGQVMATMPFPGDWKIHRSGGQGQPSITGPNNIAVTDYPLQSFLYTNDPRMQQVYYQSGQRLRAMPGIEQLIQEDLVPWAEKRGLQFVKYYEVPEVTKVDKWYNDQLYKAVPMQVQVGVIGTEWTAPDGTAFFILMHLSASTTAELQTWSYYCSTLSADKEYFERARKQYLFALANTYYPLEPIAQYNQREAEKAGRSWAEHNRRMAQNQANFEAQQRAFVNKSNAINDAIMNSWRERNAASDRNQEQFIDVITERTNVVDPTTGQRYKVSAGANQYWMNSDGEYISSNRYDYNPNLDENMNNQKWQELKETK